MALTTQSENTLLETLGAMASGGALEVFSAVTPSALIAFALPSPAFGPAVHGVMIAAPIAEVEVKSAGIAATFSILSAAGVALYNGEVGTTTGELRMNSTDIEARDLVQIQSLVVSLP